VNVCIQLHVVTSSRVTKMAVTIFDPP